MKKNQTPAQTTYEAAVESLQKFCEKETELQPLIRDEQYPICVQFIPKPQLSVFGNENIDENGEVNDLTVTVGLSTSVKSTLKFKMDSKLLKKLIKLAENVGSLYYHAFREAQGARVTPKRPTIVSGDLAYCNTCGAEMSRTEKPKHCHECGQSLDWTPDPEQDELEERLAALKRELSNGEEAEQ